MYTTIKDYLRAKSYVSIEDWAIDSGCRMISGDDESFWVDSEGYVVDIYERVRAAMETENYGMTARFVVWVGGVDDCYVDTMAEAQEIMAEWVSSGYDDVAIEVL